MDAPAVDTVAPRCRCCEIVEELAQAGGERLHFLGINVAELILALGLLILALDHEASGEAFRNAFGIVTLTDAPPTPTAALFALKVVFTAISIVLLAGAASVALGLVGRDIEEAPHESNPAGIASDD